MLKPMFVFLALLWFGFAPQQPAVPATQAAPSAPGIPPDALAMVNPVKATAASQAYAKKMYGYDCAMCHGEKGDGKGEMAAGMKPAPKDFTDAASLKDMTDGEIFYIVKNGKGEMQGEGARLKPEELWNMVVLVRSFAKK